MKRENAELRRANDILKAAAHFAIYRASHDDYEDSFLPSAAPVGTVEEASTAHAASTSTTTPHGPIHLRTNARNH